MIFVQINLAKQFLYFIQQIFLISVVSRSLNGSDFSFAKVVAGWKLRIIFQGLFHTGGSGIIRFSIADFNYENVTVGAGMKILIDGQPSQNFQLMWSLDGQGTDRNMFTHPLTNAPPEPTTIPVKAVDVAFKAALALLPASPNDQDKPEATNILGVCFFKKIELVCYVN